MPASRRQVLMTLVSAAGVLVANPLFLSPQTPQPMPSPNAPGRNFPHRMGDPDPTGPDPKTVNKQNQVEIRTEIQKLSELVSELKEEVDKTDANATLSLSVVKKAQQIEKLAKQIKDRAKN